MLCSFVFSGDIVVNIQMGVSAQRGHAVGISLAVVLVVTGAICLGAFLLFRRHRMKKHTMALMQANEEDRTQMELEADSTNSGNNQKLSSILVSNRRLRFDIARISSV